MRNQPYLKVVTMAEPTAQPTEPSPGSGSPSRTSDPDKTTPRRTPVRDPARDAERRRRRAKFLRELTEAKELRARVQPRRARAARMRQQMRMRTFRW